MITNDTFEESKRSDDTSSINFDKQICCSKSFEEKLLKAQKFLKLNIEKYSFLQKEVLFYHRKTKDVEDETIANVKKSTGLKSDILSLLEEEHNLYKNQASFNTFPTATFYMERINKFKGNQKVPSQITCLDKHVLGLKQKILEVKNKVKELSFNNVNRVVEVTITKPEFIQKLEKDIDSKKITVKELDQNIKSKELKIKILTKKFQAQKLRLRHQVAKKRAEIEENFQEKTSLNIPFRNRSAR